MIIRERIPPESDIPKAVNPLTRKTNEAFTMTKVNADFVSITISANIITIFARPMCMPRGRTGVKINSIEDRPIAIADKIPISAIYLVFISYPTDKSASLSSPFILIISLSGRQTIVCDGFEIYPVCTHILS